MIFKNTMYNYLQIINFKINNYGIIVIIYNNIKNDFKLYIRLVSY